MSKTINIDGQNIPFEEGQTIIEAATAAGVYIPIFVTNPATRLTAVVNCVRSMSMAAIARLALFQRLKDKQSSTIAGNWRKIGKESRKCYSLKAITYALHARNPAIASYRLWLTT